MVDGGGAHSMQTVYSYGGQAEGGDVDRDTLHNIIGWSMTQNTE